MKYQLKYVELIGSSTPRLSDTIEVEGLVEAFDIFIVFTIVEVW
jgi:hypothetical protein